MRITLNLLALGCALISLVISRAAAQAPGTSASETVDLTSTQRVTLHVKSATPDVAVAALAKVSGIHMQLVDVVPLPDGSTVANFARNIDIDNEPLVPAMLRICKAYGFYIRTPSGGDGVDFIQWPGTLGIAPAYNKALTLPPISISGPFSVAATEVIHERSGDPLPPDASTAGPGESSSPQTQDSVELILTTRVEPRIAILQMPDAPTISEMVDDQNRPLWDAPPQDGNDIRGAFRGAYGDSQTTNLILRLRPPAEGATRIASLKGSVQLHVCTASHRFEWTDIDRPGPQTMIVRGLRVTLDSLRDSSGQLLSTFCLDVNRNGVDISDWRKQESLLAEGSRVHVFDKAGNLLSEPYMSYQNGDSVDLLTNLPDGGAAKHKSGFGPPYRLTWDFPTEEGDVKVPFSFTNLPLPRR